VGLCNTNTAFGQSVKSEVLTKVKAISKLIRRKMVWESDLGVADNLRPEVAASS
jgi:hypothetical protein